MIKYLSTFSGIGGFELGIKQAYDYQYRQGQFPNNGEPHSEYTRSELYLAQQPLCVGYSEIDKFAIQVYQHHFPQHKNYGDITKINAAELPDFDLLVGGFPCQAFSVAGLQRGFDDTRGTLFFDLARILQEKRPRYFVFENVKGLLSHDGGATFKIIIATLTELGYDLQWQVFNSKYFGVPQNRERVFIVGNLRDEPAPEIFPFTREVREADTVSKPVKPGAQKFIKTRHLSQNGTLISDSITLQASEQAHLIDASYPGRKARVYSEIAPTVPDYGSGGNKMPMVSKTIRVGGGGSPYGSKQNWDSYKIDGVIRKLTPIECERLQGFPDYWTGRGSTYTNGIEFQADISDSQRYKMCGNAVTVNVVDWVMRGILKVTNS